MRIVATKVIPLLIVAGSVAVAAPIKIVESSLNTSKCRLEGTVTIIVEEPAFAISHHEVKSDGKFQIEVDAEGITVLHSIADRHASIEIIDPIIVARVVDKPAAPVAAAEIRLVADSTALPEGDNS